ncbi:MAG: cardiolipin synthase ClsB [Methylotenera sp.]|nr:cardiolipin synthase ClsB [Methylotenera sp.]
MIHFIGGNQIKLLRSGAEYFPALALAIEHAKHEIYLQTYIFQADVIGLRIGNALIQAAQRGVLVNVLMDGFGSQDLAKDYVQTLRLAGVQLLFYRPQLSPWSLKKNRLQRLHGKVVVIDSTIAFVGGINIIDDYNVPTQKPNNIPPRIDYAVRIEGNLLPTILANVHHLWRRMAWAHLLSVKRLTHKPSAEPSLLATSMGIKAAFVLRDNVLHRHDIEAAYLAAIYTAKSEIIIANAYFLPGRKFRKALLDAAKRGVAIKLLLQGRMAYSLMFATHAFYSGFLRNGIEIYEYRKSFMHSKVAVIDSYWATVGSSNIDPFSLLLAREANVVVQDAAFATTLRADILASIQVGAFYISPQQWIKGNLIKRTSLWLAYGLVRLFLGLIGQSNE